MPRYYQSTHSLSVPAPPERVYEALTDWTQRALWRQGMEIHWEGESRAFVNQALTFRVKGLISYSFSFRVSGLKPPRLLYIEYTGKPLRGRGAIEVVPEGGGSRVDFHWMKVEPAGFLSRLYFAVGMGMRTHRTETLKTLKLLKDYLEKQSPL